MKKEINRNDEENCERGGKRKEKRKEGRRENPKTLLTHQHVQPYFQKKSIRGNSFKSK